MSRDNTEDAYGADYSPGIGGGGAQQKTVVELPPVMAEALLCLGTLCLLSLEVGMLLE